MTTPRDGAAIRRRYLVLIGLRWFQTGLLIPIIVLLMVSRGLSLVEIGLVGSVQGIVVLVLELPTGALSDSLGRRPTLLLAYVFALAGLVTLAMADSVGGFVLATTLTAIFRALDSGPLEAWYVDATHPADPAARIETGLAAGSSVLSLGIAAGALLAGALVALDPLPAVDTLTLPVLLAVGLAVLNLVAAFVLLTEARRASGFGAIAASVRAVPSVVREGVGLLRRSRVLAAVVAVARAAIAMRILQGLTIIAMGLVAGAVGLITAYLACYLTHGASNPLHSTLLHREVDASHRTTVLSLNSMVFHPSAAIGAIVLTAIASETSLSTAMLVAGVACAIAAPLYIPALRAERHRAGLPPTEAEVA